ncbi:MULTISPECIES: hypothetical protein [Rhodobacterales]|uniref:hypothetical protein n=1 Tax=Rhodobacterales TaxID=204455 RepID=UPI0006C8410F|nr:MULTISPECIES: hypothetical protein [Rhodobacterales]KPD10497.1 hypothetical protein AN476_20760 [Phaeobacter sp. 11ANDIMAR09]
MAKKIISIGFQLPSGEIPDSDFSDKTSLLDWDIILFRPNIEHFIRNSHSFTGYEYYNGKIALNDTQSFRAKEACEHWRRELREAVDNGKTVIVHLNSPDVVYAATGTKETSGTGRNQKVTRHVAELSSYSSLPITLKATATQGSEMALRQNYRDLLAPYWGRFGSQSNYEVVFPTDTKDCCITTKHGSRPVAIQMGSKSSNGSLLLLPDLDFERDEFFDEVDDEYQSSEAANQFSSAYIAEIVGLEKSLRKTSEKTPEPDWAGSESYALSDEIRLRDDLLVAEAELKKAQKNKEQSATLLAEAGQLRDLLFETGKPLEAAILKALRILGFEASNFEDANSEFDAVFESTEGRLLGEAEGRDNKPIAIGKLRQLSTNIHEDLEREDVLVPAKGILFGNAFRLTKPNERDESFTDKCKTSAVSMSLGLVSTPELFRIAQYLSSCADGEFAIACRKALVETSGEIVFPNTPDAYVDSRKPPEVRRAEPA